MAELKRVLVEHGVEVREQCDATGFAREHGIARAVRTAAGDIEAEHFVVATGAWRRS